MSIKRKLRAAGWGLVSAISLTWLAPLFGLAPQTAAADEPTEPDNTSSDTSVRRPITVSAKFMYLFDDYAIDYVVKATPTSESINLSEPFQIPMIGLSASFQPFEDPKLSTAVSLMYGRDAETKTVATGGAVTPTDLTFSRLRDNIDYRRIDAELTAQYRFNDLTAIVGGLRYEQARLKHGGCNQFWQYQPGFDYPTRLPTYAEVDGYCDSLSSSQTEKEVNDGRPWRSYQEVRNAAGNLTTVATPSLSARLRETDGYDLYTARLGFAGVVPMTEDRKHQLYVNLLGVGGYRQAMTKSQTRFDTAWVVGPDISAGYTYQLNTKMNFDVRYRAIALFPLSGRSDFGNTKVTHGLQVSVSTRF